MMSKKELALEVVSAVVLIGLWVAVAILWLKSPFYY